jgi:hypothetical protein
MESCNRKGWLTPYRRWWPFILIIFLLCTGLLLQAPQLERWATVALVAITLLYAISMQEQAEASKRMADEMHESKIALGLAEKTRSLPAFLGRDYLDRSLSSPLHIPYGDAYNLKDVRVFVRTELETRGNESREKLRKRFINSTLEKGSWQNRYTHELSLELQRLGAMVLAGAIPVNLVLAFHGYSIIEDWGYCSPLLECKIRGTKTPMREIDIDQKMEIPFHRRHAEWLACAAAIYMSQYFKGGNLDELLLSFGNDMEGIREREKAIRESETELKVIPDGTQREIRELLELSCRAKAH